MGALLARQCEYVESS